MKKLSFLLLILGGCLPARTSVHASATTWTWSATVTVNVEK